MRLPLTLITTLAVAVPLAGCETMLENRVMRTLDGDRAVVESRLGAFGLTLHLSEKDVRALRRLDNQAAAAAATAQAAQPAASASR